MALKIVGSGLGRTGTKSMQTALNMLGFGPCHHMVEVFTHPESMALWVRASKGEDVWDEIFKDYNSAVDYPVAAYWREVADKYPNAKVLHTTRDADQWYDSAYSTILSPNSPATQARTEAGSVQGEFFASFAGTLRQHIDDRAWMTDYFRRHDAEVKAAFPSERLLVYQVGSGWDPLCKFLGVPVPDVPYPSENSRGEFIARIQRAQGDTAHMAEEIKAGEQSH
ncbi:MAG TPA: sulfotransferase [Caulobacteraceae bacterium]|nr:sulfotransferase [Caulobacteraceae bacterium]